MEKVEKLKKKSKKFKRLLMTKKVSKSYFSKSDVGNVARIGIKMGIL